MRCAIEQRRVTRRTFLAAAAMGGLGATAWLGTSGWWSARFLRERATELGREVLPAPHTPAPATWRDNAITLAWLGHASVLINFI